jgi:uncharacterized damage-inducible protein DinB
MRYHFLTDTYRTERLKVLGVWSMFQDENLPFRPHPTDPRGRSVLEQMVHQCMSEAMWFRRFFGIETLSEALPVRETRLGFIEHYALDSSMRLEKLLAKDDSWWEEEVQFFDTPRQRTWVMVRRVAHTSHHRGQQMAILRMLGRDLHSNYGPTADTGGLAQNGAVVVYPYPDAATLIASENRGAEKAPLPGVGAKPSTERPDLVQKRTP